MDQTTVVGHLPADTTIAWAKNVVRAVLGRLVIARCGVEYDHDALVHTNPADIEHCRSCIAGTPWESWLAADHTENTTRGADR